jgi:hypothetical protein
MFRVFAIIVTMVAALAVPASAENSSSDFSQSQGASMYQRIDAPEGVTHFFFSFWERGSVKWQMSGGNLLLDIQPVQGGFCAQEDFCPLGGVCQSVSWVCGENPVIQRSGRNVVVHTEEGYDFSFSVGNEEPTEDSNLATTKRGEANKCLRYSQGIRLSGLGELITPNGEVFVDTMSSAYDSWSWAESGGEFSLYSCGYGGGKG